MQHDLSCVVRTKTERRNNLVSRNIFQSSAIHKRLAVTFRSPSKLDPPTNGEAMCINQMKKRDSHYSRRSVGWKSADLSRLRCRCNSPESRNIQTLYPNPFRSNVCFRLTAQPVPEFRTLGGKNSKFVRLG